MSQYQCSSIFFAVNAEKKREVQEKRIDPDGEKPFDRRSPI